MQSVKGHLHGSSFTLALALDRYVPACHCSSPRPQPSPSIYPHPTLTRAPLHALAFTLADRSGEPVQVDAARYITHHDAEGIGAFLDADFDDLASVVSFTVDYLAGIPRHVEATHSVACTVPQPGAWRACGVCFVPLHQSTPTLDARAHTQAFH